MSKIFSCTVGILTFVMFAFASLQSMNTLNSEKVIPYQSQMWVGQHY